MVNTHDPKNRPCSLGEFKRPSPCPSLVDSSKLASRLWIVDRLQRRLLDQWFSFHEENYRMWMFITESLDTALFPILLCVTLSFSHIFPFPHLSFFLSISFTLSHPFLSLSSPFLPFVLSLSFRVSLSFFFLLYLSISLSIAFPLSPPSRSLSLSLSPVLSRSLFISHYPSLSHISLSPFLLSLSLCHLYMSLSLYIYLSHTHSSFFFFLWASL